MATALFAHASRDVTVLSSTVHQRGRSEVLPTPSRREQRNIDRALAFALRESPAWDALRQGSGTGADPQRGHVRRTTHDAGRGTPRPGRTPGYRVAAMDDPPLAARMPLPSARIRSAHVPSAHLSTGDVSANRPVGARSGHSGAAHSGADRTHTAAAPRPVVRPTRAQLRETEAVVSGATARRLDPLPADRTLPSEETRPSLKVVRQPKNATTKRRKRGFPFFSSLLLLGIFGVAGGAVFLHASLAQTQMTVDRLNTDIANAERLNQRLRVEVATLESPERIVGVAESLGLEPSESVRFLSAVSRHGGSVPIASTPILPE